MSDDAKWYIVIADTQSGESTLVAFGEDTDAATTEYGVLEEKYRHDTTRYEVVLIGADDEDSVRSMYPHWFTGLPRAEAKHLAMSWLSKPAYG